MLMERVLVLATRNEHKIRELTELLAGLPVKLLSLADFPDIPDIAEAGDSFEENAVAKASAIAYLTKRVALADDSGLEVDALGGAPGILSNRYAGEGASDQEKIDKLLAELPDSNKSARTARFRCALAVCEPTGGLEVFEGRCDGWISLLPLGSRGFGYDPVFVVPELEKTMAELDPAIKNLVSHRARAVRKVRPHIMKVFGISEEEVVEPPTVPLDLAP
jgi:XTP/dITP diphosphohydrolase